MGGPTGPSALTATAAGMQAAKTVRHARAAATMRDYGAEDACVRSVALFLCRWMGVRMFTVCYLPFSAVPLGNAAGITPRTRSLRYGRVVVNPEDSGCCRAVLGAPPLRILL